MRAPQWREGTCVTERSPSWEVFHQSSSMISEKPRSATRSETCVGTMMAVAVPPVRKFFFTLGRTEGRAGETAGDPQPGAAKFLEHEQPGSKIGIDEPAAPADLHEKTGVADKSNAQIAVPGQARSVGLAAARGDGRVAYQARKLRSAFT